MILFIPEERRHADIERVSVIDGFTPEQMSAENLAFWRSLDTHLELKPSEILFSFSLTKAMTCPRAEPSRSNP